MLTVRELTKTYSGRGGVRSLSFDVAPGTIVALLGPNGAGKTTALTTLAGLARLESGAIAWNGESLGRRRNQVLSLVPEVPVVFPLLTVWEHLVFVALGARLTGSWRDEAEALLDRFSLGDARDDLGDALSMGMRQKVLLACAVLTRTPVLLLDEPMVGLDPQGQDELQRVLRELRASGTAIVLSSHVIPFVDPLCDSAVILDHGALVFAGPRDALVDDYGSVEAAFRALTS